MSVPSYLVPPPGRPVYYQEPGLGLSSLGTAGSAGLAVATGGTSSLIQSAVGLVGSFLGPLGSIFSGSDPKKDMERKARTDSYYAGAMAGDPSSLARLKCYAGITTPEMVALVSGGNPQCSPSDPLGQAAGSAISRGYARAKLAEYEARVAAGNVGGVLIGQSNIPTTIAGTVSRAAQSPMVWAGLAVAAFLVLRKRR